MRNTIFISHATPEDNAFTIWLSSRLIQLGYDVWIDKNGLLGGEKFWEDIDQVIRNKAAKVLLVYSTNICLKDKEGNLLPGKIKEGIYKEYSLAESIAKENNFSDFLILLNIDNAPYNLFIGSDRLVQIPFYENWADGLRQIEKKLIKDNVAKNSHGDTGFGEWYETQYIVPNRIVGKSELYYSNLWPVNKLPEYFYIYTFQNEHLARQVYEQQSEYPISKISNNLSSFAHISHFGVTNNNEIIQIKPLSEFKIKISTLLSGFESDRFPNHRDASNHLKQLLKRVFHLLMKKRGMFWYEMANKRLAYFYTPANLSTLKVKFEYPFRQHSKFKQKNLIGKYKKHGKWHFATSVKVIFDPKIAFSLKSHIVFTDNGFDVWKNDKGEIDKNKIHSQRRSKGKTMFNEEWRDLLIAFINGLKIDDKIDLPLNDDFTLEMPFVTDFFWADFGYFDPKDKSRQGLLIADDKFELLDENMTESATDN